MNLGQIRASVERRTGVSFDATASNEIINEALQTLSSEERWPWLQTSWSPVMLAGVGVYALPSGTTAVRAVKVQGEEISRSTITAMDGDLSVVGWTVEAEQLVLSPLPIGTETVLVRINQVEPALAADGDTPLLPKEWHAQAIVNLAASMVLERNDDLDRAERRRKEYDRALTRMRHVVRRAHAPTAARVRPGGGI